MEYEIDYDEISVISASRKDLLSEGALIQVEITQFDVSGTWERGGQEHHFEKLQLLEKDCEIRQAINTVLATSACEDIMKASLEKLSELRSNYPTARCLMVCKDIAAADRIHKKLLKFGYAAEIATSADSKAAEEAIEKFKFGNSNVLVTCAMCYEGLDCKPIAIVCLLTNIRSKPWIEQAIARGTRFDPNGPADQHCYVFAPHDQKMQAVLERIKEEDVAFARESEDANQITGKAGGSFDPIVPLNSAIAGVSWRDLDTGADLGAESRDQILTEKHGVPPIPHTTKRENKRLRKAIATEANALARTHRVSPEEINCWIKHHFQDGRSRKDLSNEELMIVLREVKGKDAIH